MLTEKKLTGYPSIDKPWLKYYDKELLEKYNTNLSDMVVWDFVEDKLKEHLDIPAISYFGKKISRTKFIKQVYLWAKALKVFGVKEDEVIPIYGPFLPDICMITFALNLIGATPYFLKLSISQSSLEEETAKSDKAIVFDGMWESVKSVFSHNRFTKIMLVSAKDSMPFIQKCFFKLTGGKLNKEFKAREKYFFAKDVLKLHEKHVGSIRGKNKPNRAAFITSSSGTTVNGVVKGTIATNETAITQIVQAFKADVNYISGGKCLTNLPPTASTSLNCLFFLPLCFGMTVVIEPRLSEEGFYKQLLKYKPQVALMTGSFWEAAFRRVKKDLQKGKRIDLSFFEMPIVGGEGVIREDLKDMNNLLEKCGSKVPLFNGYGLSEVFSVFSVDKANMLADVDYGKAVTDIGIPYPDFTAGIFDEHGKEVGYGIRGELWVKTSATMQGYYNKQQLTEKTIVDGWLHTGDICEIDENGILYYYGRKTDEIKRNGHSFYLFDIATEIRKNADVKYAIVNAMPKDKLVAHIVLADEKEINIAMLLNDLDENISKVFSNNIIISGYMIHKTTLPSSPTTAKKDRNGLIKKTDGYLKVVDKRVEEISF